MPLKAIVKAQFSVYKDDSRKLKLVLNRQCASKTSFSVVQKEKIIAEYLD